MKNKIQYYKNHIEYTLEFNNPSECLNEWDRLTMIEKSIDYGEMTVVIDGSEYREEI